MGQRQWWLIPKKDIEYSRRRQSASHGEDTTNHQAPTDLLPPAGEYQGSLAVNIPEHTLRGRSIPVGINADIVVERSSDLPYHTTTRCYQANREPNLVIPETYALVCPAERLSQLLCVNRAQQGASRWRVEVFCR
jgi:hypothetical protein